MNVNFSYSFLFLLSAHFSWSLLLKQILLSLSIYYNNIRLVHPDIFHTNIYVISRNNDTFGKLVLVVFLINEGLKEYIFHNSIYVNLFKCKIQKNFCIAKLYVFCIFENVSHFEQRGIIKYSVFDIKYLLTKFKMPRWIHFHAFRNVNIVSSRT